MIDNEIECVIDKNGDKYYVLKNSNLDLSDKNIKEVNDDLKELNSKFYYKGKLIHREDGPAIDLDNGTKVWYKNGLKHREDGPAIEWKNGDKYYYINGTEISKKNFYLEKELRKNLSKNNLNNKKMKV